MIRIVLAALIASSVAALPATGAVAFLTKPVEMSMPDHADVPCCPCCNTQDDRGSVACAIKCMSSFGAVLPAMATAQPYLVGEARPSFVDDNLQGHERSPPTHPPPV